jgi:hypothetical protein
MSLSLAINNTSKRTLSVLLNNSYNTIHNNLITDMKKKKFFCDCDYYSCHCITYGTHCNLDKKSINEFAKHILDNGFHNRYNKKITKTKSNQNYNYLLEQWTY